MSTLTPELVRSELAHMAIPPIQSTMVAVTEPCRLDMLFIWHGCSGRRAITWPFVVAAEILTGVRRNAYMGLVGIFVFTISSMCRHSGLFSWWSAMARG